MQKRKTKRSSKVAQLPRSWLRLKLAFAAENLNDGVSSITRDQNDFLCLAVEANDASGDVSVKADFAACWNAWFNQKRSNGLTTTRVFLQKLVKLRVLVR